MIGWLTDFFRLAGGLLYWNGRKTAFRWRRQPCPCQSPSDSGRAGETRCEACPTWNQPWRFRHICPDLRQTPAGLCCGVDTADVRPFWGRALAYYATGGLAAYLLIVLVAFGLLRRIGYPVQLGDLAWPPAWHRIQESRATYFLERGTHALATGNLREALFSLNIAYELHPDNYTAGLTLARLCQTGQPAFSDQIYEQLLQRHPAQAPQTAQAWLRALLARGAFSQLQTLAYQRVLAEPATAAPWLHALIFASRQRHDPTPIQRLLETPTGQPWRALLETELLWLAGRQADVTPRLLQAWTPAHPYCVRYQADLLLTLHQPTAAVERLAAVPRLPNSEQVRIFFAACATGGARDRLRREVGNLLGATPTAPAVDLLATHLIRYPDADLLALVVDRVIATPLPPTDDAFVAYNALFCAAGVGHDATRQRQLAGLLKQRACSTYAAIDAAQEFFARREHPQGIGGVLIALMLSLDTTYALHERYPLAMSPARP